MLIGKVLLNNSSNNTISSNTCNSNKYGIRLRNSSNNNSIYLNNFSNNTTGNVYSDGSTNNTWSSPTKLGYLYGAGSTETYKNYMGNYYSDRGGNDSNSDGICDDPYAYTTDGSNDQDPLWQTTDNYGFQTWWLSNPTMYRGDMSKAGATVTVSTYGSQIWAANQDAQTSVSFGAGDPEQETTWTGQVTFASAPTSGHTFTVEIGYADEHNGANFWEDGPEATITGDGSTKVFTYTTTAVSFSVAQSKYLVMKITNNSGSDYDVRVGGSWSYCSAPQGSGNYPTAVTLSSFAARSGSQGIFSPWPWLGLVGLAALGLGGVVWAKRRVG